MAYSFLGPESPRPFSVISESYQHTFILPKFSEIDMYCFGTEYEDKLFEFIHKYLDLETMDRLCYVGDVKGSIADKLKERFCLMEPVMTIIPGHYSYVETDTQKMLSIRIAHVGAEEYFRSQALLKPDKRQIFDKIILKDAIRYFQNPTELYENMMKCMSKDSRLLIVHRPSNVNTLPIFNNAKQRLEDNETPYTDIIKDLHSCNLDVQWEIEALPVLMPKRKWFSMLKGKFPPQIEIMSDSEIVSGMRELTEGILKYEGEMVEFTDRLLFITVTPTRTKSGMAKIRRYSAPDYESYQAANLKYSMVVTPELRRYVVTPGREAKKESGGFPWG
ncbi:hypothetical protein ACJMK2_003778 [Sinanodonta woodiana]|uniref:Uncharacterized protein n=1 Tax=Sinanodonta woodiana TaxID=1069815 RepID=A0ABD3Y288_SINWO